MKNVLFKDLSLKGIALFLAVVLALPGAIVNVAASEEKASYGDVSLDGTIDANDALDVLKYAAKLSELTEEQKAVADVTDDKTIDASDALEILKYAAKIINKFPVEENIDTTPAITDEPEDPTETPEITVEPTETPEITVEPTETPVITVEPTETPIVEPTATPEPTPTPTCMLPTDTPVPPATETPIPTDTPVPTEAPNPITYDSESDTYTMHGQNITWTGEKDGTNASYEIENPLAGLNLTEELTIGEEGYPVWNEGATISYDVFVPEEAKDAVILSFEKTELKVHRDDRLKIEKINAYSADDPSYAIGETAVYVDDAGNEYTVMLNPGSNVRYNPDYPEEGYYVLTDKDKVADVIKKGEDASVAENWVMIKNAGAGYYAGYNSTYSSGNTDSKVREAEMTSTLSIYASGSVMYSEEGFSGDPDASIETNPNNSNYGKPVSYSADNLFILTANGAPGVAESKVENALKSPTVTEYGKWHSVVITLQNDWIHVYIDGVKLTPIEYYNYWGTIVSHNPTYTARKIFNYGYGGKYWHQTKGPSEANKFGELITDFITDYNTVLRVGGKSFRSDQSQIGKVGTPEGVQVKNIKFYGSVAADENVTAEGLKDMTEVDHSTLQKLNVANINSSAVLDENGVYTFIKPVAQGTNTINKNVDGVATDVVYDLYYGVEFENPFVGNKRIQQSVLEALDGQLLIPANSVAASKDTLKLEYGNYGDTYYGDPFKKVDELTEEEKNPVLSSVYMKYQRPVYTKGATVSFWYNSADVTSNSPIFTMYGEGQSLFVMLADGTVAYFDMNGHEWKNGTLGHIGDSHCTNGFFAQGDASRVNSGVWHYYTVTFANDWIQVYIDGTELIYNFVALEMSNKTMLQRFNGGYGTRYNPTGLLTEEPDPVRQYATKNQAIASISKDDLGNYVYNYNNSADIAVRNHQKVYTYSAGYRAVEYKDGLPAYYVLMMDRLTSSDMKFYIGGCPTEMSMAMNANLTEAGFNPTMAGAGPGNKVKIEGISIDTNHNQEGSRFKDVSFAAIEFDAEKAFSAYEEAAANAEPAPSNSYTFEENELVTLNSEYNGSVVESVDIGDGLMSNVIKLGAAAESGAIGVELGNPLAGKAEYKQTLKEGLINGNAALKGNFANLLVNKDTYYQLTADYVAGVTYPIPVYSNGVIVSAWVKMPEGATANTPIISFGRWHDTYGNGVLTLTANGNVGFQAGDDQKERRRNAVLYYNKDQKNSPLKKAGQWVYVTLTIENYQMQVYFNGVKASLVLDEAYLGTAGKFFNKGFSAIGYHDPAKVEDRRNNYRDLFNKFTIEEVDAFLSAKSTEGADVSKFVFLNSNQELLVDWVVQDNTKLYLGGSDKTLSLGHRDSTKAGATALTSCYDANSAGTLIDDVTIEAYATGFDADKLAKEAYENSISHK